MFKLCGGINKHCITYILRFYERGKCCQQMFVSLVSGLLNLNGNPSTIPRYPLYMDKSCLVKKIYCHKSGILLCMIPL